MTKRVLRLTARLLALLLCLTLAGIGSAVAGLTNGDTQVHLWPTGVVVAEKFNRLYALVTQEPTAIVTRATTGVRPRARKR